MHAPWLLVTQLVIPLVAASTALAQPITKARDNPTATALSRALISGHHSEIARLGTRGGARALAPIMDSADRLAVLAATLAAPAAADAWALLGALAARAAGPDRPVAVAAAVSAARIAARLQRDWNQVYTGHDIAADELMAHLQLWQQIAADRERWPDIRVHALDVCARLDVVRRNQQKRSHAGHGRASQRPPQQSTQPPQQRRQHSQHGPNWPQPASDSWLALAQDPEPAVRRAFFELYGSAPGDMLSAAARAAAADDEPAVALAAAQALCSGIGFGAPPQPILAVLGPAGLRRLRTLVADPDLAPAARIDGGRCLAADPAPASRRALQTLVATLPSSLRPSARRLLSQSR